MGLLKPEEIDKRTGYRMYSTQQIPILNKIIYLRDSGFNVAEIAVALNNQEDSFVIEQLDDKHREIERAIQIEKEKLKKIELAKKGLQSTKHEIHYNIFIKSVPSYQVLALRRIIPNYYSEGDLWQELSAFAAQHQVEVSSNAFSIYHDLEYKETNVDVELCAPVKRQGKAQEILHFALLNRYLTWPVQWYMGPLPTLQELIWLLRSGCKRTANIECQGYQGKLYIVGHGMKLTLKNILLKFKSN